MKERTERVAVSKLRDIPERGSFNIQKEVKELVRLDKDKFFAPATGLKYGDLNYFDRATFPFDYSELLTNPVYIIEFLLRRYTSYGDMIDAVQFDAVAPTVQLSYKFSLNEEISLATLINELLRPFFGVLYMVTNKIRINTLLNKNVVDTITTDDVLKMNGQLLVNCYFDYNLYSYFEFNLGYQTTSKDYGFKYSITPESYTIQFPDLQNPSIVCNQLLTNYGINSKLIFNYNYGNQTWWIKKVFDYYTNLKMIVDLRLPVKEGIRYELGDYVLLNIPEMIPESYNNSKKFIIIGKEVALITDAYVKLRLMSSPFSGY